MEKNRRRSKYMNLLVFIAALLVLWLWNRHSPQKEILVELGETYLTVTGPESFEKTVAYEDIRALRLYDEGPDLGTMVSGTTTRHAWYGRWQNGLWGEYTLAIDPGIRTFLVLRAGEEVVLVLNFESGEMTAALYDALTEWMDSGG